MVNYKSCGIKSPQDNNLEWMYRRGAVDRDMQKVIDVFESFYNGTLEADLLTPKNVEETNA